MAWLNFEDISRRQHSVRTLYEILTRLKVILSLIWHAVDVRYSEQLIVGMFTQLCDHRKSC